MNRRKLWWCSVIDVIVFGIIVVYVAAPTTLFWIAVVCESIERRLMR